MPSLWMPVCPYLLSHFPSHYQKPHSYPQVFSLFYARQASLNNPWPHKHLRGALCLDPSLNVLGHPAIDASSHLVLLSVWGAARALYGDVGTYQSLAPCSVGMWGLPPLPGRHPAVGGNVWPSPVSSQISRNLGKLYSEMIFVNGFVHCDPHPGNVLVKKCPASGKAHIILLDHGLYQVCSYWGASRALWGCLWASGWKSIPGCTLAHLTLY